MHAKEFSKKGNESTLATQNLRLDIKVTTSLKKTLQEIVLNSYVDITLREFLGIVKKELHYTITDLIKT